MSVWRLAAVLAASCLLSGQAVAATAKAAPPCDEQRHQLSEQLQKARLRGHQARQAQLNDQLQALNQQCQGLIALGARHTNATEQASRRVERRELLLRAALATGDAQLIALRKDQLAKARAQLEAVRRP